MNRGVSSLARERVCHKHVGALHARTFLVPNLQWLATVDGNRGGEGRSSQVCENPSVWGSVTTTTTGASRGERECDAGAVGVC